MRREGVLHAGETPFGSDALRARAIGESTPYLIVEFDETGRILYLSPNHREIVGPSPEGWREWDWLRTVHPEDRGTMRAALEQGAADGSVRVLLRARHADGGWHWFECFLASFRNPSDELRLLGIGHDVSEARMHDERSQILRGSSLDLIAEIDERGILVFVSRANETILGHSPEELVGTPLLDYLHADDVAKVVAVLERLTPGDPTRMRARFRHGDGSWRRIDLTATSYRNAEGEQRILGVGRDVSDGVALEQALQEAKRRAQRLAASQEERLEEERARIAREIHDELGQGLTALRLRLSSGYEGSGSDRSQREAMLAQIDRLIEAVRRIGGRTLPPSLEEFGLVAAIESQARSLAEASGWKLRTELTPIETRLDSRQEAALFRVAQESLTNIARHAGASRVEVRLEVLDDRLRLSVSDDGCGIPQERARSPRSGGIGGMRTRAEALGAALTIDGNPASGTVVRLEVPRPAASAGPDRPPPGNDGRTTFRQPRGLPGRRGAPD